MTKRTLTATTALALTLGFGDAALAQSVIGSEGDRIALTGTVESLETDSFVVSYGADTVEVEFDSLFTTVDVEENLAQGDRVTVYGTVDNDWFEGRVIDAESVFIETNQTYYSGATMTDPLYTSPTAGMDGTYVVLEGTVESVDGREFTLASGGADISVDTASMEENLLDMEGNRQIVVGDRVAVAGALDSGLFDEMELSASTITTLRGGGSTAGSMGGMASSTDGQMNTASSSSAQTSTAQSTGTATAGSMDVAEMDSDQEPVDATYDPERADQNAELSVDGDGESEYAQTMDGDSPAVDNDANDMGETTVASTPVADNTDNMDDMELAEAGDTDRPQPSSGSDMNADADMEAMEPEMAEAGQSDTEEVYAETEEADAGTDEGMEQSEQRTASNTPERVDPNTSAEDLNRMTMNEGSSENEDAAPTELSLSNSTDMDAGTTVDPSADDAEAGTEMASSGSTSADTAAAGSQTQMAQSDMTDAGDTASSDGMESAETEMADADTATESEADSSAQMADASESDSDSTAQMADADESGIATDTSQDEFAAMDEDGNGVLTREEFIAYVADPDNITREEAGRLFQVTARDDDELTREEFLTPSEEIDRVASEIVQ